MGNSILAEHNDLCVGIDLGTTNSVLATINEKPNGDVVSKVVEISRGVDMYNAVTGDVKLTTMKKPTLPSCIYYRQEKNYEPIVGDFAKMQYPLRPHLVAKSIKSQMGNPLAEGLAPDIPDKTPAEIAARTLKHMIKETSKVYRCEITDAVITVPANFDPAMCKATRDAAELAGIKVRNSDGSERPVLLSEPNAVIYDLINQIRNGEISSHILDLSTPKRVLVFDLGGGTLDITMHEIKRRDGKGDVLKVDEIATNRYTRLGGDDFDVEIAKEMFARYLKQYEKHADVVHKLRQNEKVIMAQLVAFAEQLKLEVNERCSEDYDSGWDDPDDEIDFPVGGNMGGIGYSYDDTFTREEVESILSGFMAKELSYNDYKHIDKITNTGNMIYPVLDVLKKASEKLGTEDVIVDAVIVNGGMSKFYMVTDRLKEFFGFEPIVALDPDQAVARGAAVYHYYLHKFEEMQDDMKLLGDTDGIPAGSTAAEKGFEKSRDVFGQKTALKPAAANMAIQWGSNILNDSLYLGIKNGAVHKIIPTGAELPYTSDIMTGFRIEPGQNIISIPIKSRNIDGTYRTISSGNISFRQRYENGAYVAFRIHMGSNKVITMKAWTSKDPDGIAKIEEGYADIAIDNSEKSRTKTKFMAPSGMNLQPKAEINNMLQLCSNFQKARNKTEKSHISKRIAASATSICNAGNKDEFADVILEALMSESCEEARQRLFIISRKICSFWNDEKRRRLAAMCMSQISAELSGFPAGGAKTSTNIQAVYTLSACAGEAQMTKLEALHDTSRFLQACLYAHAKTGTGINWLQEQFFADARNVERGRGSNIQFSSHSIGVALRKTGEGVNLVSVEEEKKIVQELCGLIRTGNLSSEELTCCILALGCICDARNGEAAVDTEIRKDVISAIRDAQDFNSDLVMQRQDKCREVALKMINGDILNTDEERFLLTRLEK